MNFVKLRKRLLTESKSKKVKHGFLSVKIVAINQKVYQTTVTAELGKAIDIKKSQVCNRLGIFNILFSTISPQTSPFQHLKTQ